MKSRKLITSLAMAFFFMPILVACGPTRVDVAMTTYKFTLDKSSAPAGEITFHVHNDAADVAPTRRRCAPCRPRLQRQ